MTRRIFTIILLASLAAAAQETQRHYARAYYTKWKPGMAAEGQAFLKDVAAKAARSWVQGDPSAIGQITMLRLLPGGSGVDHDRLRLTITNRPPDPDFVREISPGSPKFVEAAGMKPADYQAKIRTFFDTVRTEVWSNEIRYGSIKEGDYVRVAWIKVPSAKRTARADYYRAWENAVWAEAVKQGTVRAIERWTVLFAASEEPSSVSFGAFPDVASFYKGLGNRQEIFRKAHPGKDYHAYRQADDASGEGSSGTQTIIYRVDAAVWK